MSSHMKGKGVNTMNMRDHPRETRPGPAQPFGELGRPFSRLRYERMRRGWLQKEVAKKIGVSKVTVNRWESGAVFPQPLYCRKLCKLFGLDFEELFPEGPRSIRTDGVQVVASIVLIQTNGLKQARQRLGFSQSELAKAISVRRGTVNRWERGLGSPNLPHLRKLCQLFGMTPEELFPDTISESGSPASEGAEVIETPLSTARSSGQHFFDY